jgi:hypothetical protein
MTISKSPERHTFQAEGYIKRCEEEGKEPSEDYLNLFKSARERDDENMINPEWQKDNMEYDLRSTDWILEKARASESYAQNLYAAMCNMQFIKLDTMPILKNQRWSASWRHSGGIVADMLGKGDYIDWYCSGIRDSVESEDEPKNYTEEQMARLEVTKRYVPEGVVTDEIRADLNRLGWAPVPWEDDE